MLIGIGHEERPFEPGGVLMLGGVKIEGSWGLRSEGDGDVLLGAVADALLGAAALGQRSDHFPREETGWKDVPSAVLLSEVVTKLRARGLRPGNVDVTVAAERPDVGAFRAAIRERVATLLSLPAERVSIKTAAYRGLGALGRAEGIGATAVVLLGEQDA